MGWMETIVLAMGVAPVRQLYVIGEAENPATALKAFAAGTEVGR